MSIAYCPGGRAGKRSCPFSLVVSASAPPISAGELRRTTACGSTPPWASLTVPISAPVNTCAAATCTCNTHAAARRNVRGLRMGELLSPRVRVNRCSSNNPGHEPSKGWSTGGVTPGFYARSPWQTRRLPALHRVQVDVVGDRLANGVARLDGAGIVHTAPDPGVVTVRARLRDARVSPRYVDRL